MPQRVLLLLILLLSASTSIAGELRVGNAVIPYTVPNGYAPLPANRHAEMIAPLQEALKKHDWHAVLVPDVKADPLSATSLDNVIYIVSNQAYHNDIIRQKDFIRYKEALLSILGDQRTINPADGASKESLSRISFNSRPGSASEPVVFTNTETAIGYAAVITQERGERGNGIAFLAHSSVTIVARGTLVSVLYYRYVRSPEEFPEFIADSLNLVEALAIPESVAPDDNSLPGRLHAFLKDIPQGVWGALIAVVLVYFAYGRKRK